MSSTGDKVAGKAKEWAGKATGNEEMEAEGRTQHTKGEVKETAEDARDTAKGTWKGATGDKGATGER
jgi:uncharacterized protein YjbJ (UPF0337 family)